jgi:uncharacterized protein YceK
MKTKIILAILTALMLLLSGCSSVQFWSGNDPKEMTGLKFYTSKPYLLVEYMAEKDLTVRTTILYLPDLADPQYMKVRPGMGSNDLKMTFEKSILSSYGNATYSDVAGMLNSLAGVISKGAAAAGALASPGYKQQSRGEEFALFEILFTKDGTKLKRVNIN